MGPETGMMSAGSALRPRMSISVAPVRPWLEDAMEPRIRIVQRFDASPERVFAAWLDPATAGRWLFATASRPVSEVAIDARVGGSFRFVERRRGRVARQVGRYLEIVPARRLAFTLEASGHPEALSRVTIDIAPCGQGCELVLSQALVAPDDLERTEGRWMGILYGLGEALGAMISMEQ
jgi:uncharacterized protein YndB with AHSA1/START domain